MMPLRAAVTAVLLACASQLNIATAANRDVSSDIDGLRGTITSGEVYLVDRGILFIHTLEEHDITRPGCRHAHIAAGSADLESLIDVLVNAALAEIPHGTNGADARIVVYLYQGASRRYALVLTTDYNNKNATGTFRLDGDSEPVGSAIAVEATKRIESDLRIWAAQHESLKVQECQSQRPNPG